MSRWILVLAGSCVVLGVLLKVADLRQAGTPAAHPEHAAAPARVPHAKAPERGSGASLGRDPSEPGGVANPEARVARRPGGEGSDEFPDLLGPGFHPNRPSALSGQRLARKAARKQAREARRLARLDVRRSGGEPPAPGAPGHGPGGSGAQPGAPGSAPPAVEPVAVPPGTGLVFQSDAAVQYPLDTPVEIPDVAKLAGGRGSVSFWLQPQWQDGNQDDATFFDIDGKLQLIKNVNFLRFEVIDDQGTMHGIGAPITDWKAGEWHQIATSWNGNVIQLYFDGRLMSQTTIPGAFNLPQDTGMTIGSNFPESRPIAPGLMNGLGVQNRPLSPTDVLAAFKAGLGH